MAKITYTVGANSGEITWVACEFFGELDGKDFSLGKMEAAEIEKLHGLSSTTKILLSAVSGAVIQHLLDAGVSPDDIFTIGEIHIDAAA